jgi:hypothetical protein
VKRGRLADDDAPMSVFVREMKAAFLRREQAHGLREKRAITQELEAIMRQHLGRGAWDAAAGFKTAAVRVPRDARRHRCHVDGAPVESRESGPIDRKTLAAGPEPE